MKIVRLILLIAITAAIIGVAFLVSRYSVGAGGGFTTARQCMDAFYAAGIDGDAERLAACLAEALKDQAQQLAKEKGDLMNYVTHEEAQVDKSTAEVVMDETRREATQRVRFRLENQAAGWRIAAIGSPTTVKMNVPYGTHVGKVPNP